MAGTHGVLLIGFTAFERSTLEAFFRLAARRSPAYVHASSAEQANVVLVDADRADALRDPRAVPGRSIFIGASGRDGQLAQLSRPINMMSLLKVLDACVVQTAAQRSSAPPPAAVGSAPAVVAPLIAPAPNAAHGRSAAPPQAARLADRDQAIRSPKPGAIDHILVVDDSEIALRFMVGCLGRFGFHVHLARSGEEALRRVCEEHFAFVFMDVTMQGIDGYQTCKLIKKRPYPAGRRAPTVVMLTSRGGTVDRIRGTLAGCDAYLTKPLNQDGLMKVIGNRTVTDVADADTARLSLPVP